MSGFGAAVLALLAVGAGPQDEAVDMRQLPVGNTPVQVALVVLDLVSIDDAAQVAFVDFAVRMDWHDDRLEGVFDRVAQFDAAAVRVPPIAFMNDRTLRRGLAETVSVFPTGDVRYVQRFTGEISVALDLSDFPWDRETLEIAIIFPVFPDEATLRLNPEFSGVPPEWTIANWNLGEPTFEVVSGSRFSPAHYQLIYRQPIERDPTYYIWTVIVPLLLVVAMSWVAFWINPERVEAQLAVAATSMLSLVAFRFAVAQLVPPLSYFTRLDVFMTGSTLLVFFALVEVAGTSYMQQGGKHDLALRVDVGARLAFPAALAVLLWIAFWMG